MDTGTTNFKLPNVALYAKLHYARSNDFWDDITKCLEADDYEPYTHEDIVTIVMRHTIPLMTKDVMIYTQNLLEAINPRSCWKYGYYTKDHKWAANKWKELESVEYDVQAAMLWFYLSHLQGEEVKNLGKLPKADENVLPLRNQEISIV